MRWANKNTCWWHVLLVISVPKIFLNGQFYFNLSSKTWSHVFWNTVYIRLLKILIVIGLCLIMPPSGQTGRHNVLMLSVCLSVHPSVCPSVRPFVHSSVCYQTREHDILKKIFNRFRCQLAEMVHRGANAWNSQSNLGTRRSQMNVTRGGWHIRSPGGNIILESWPPMGRGGFQFFIILYRRRHRLLPHGFADWKYGRDVAVDACYDVTVT